MVADVEMMMYSGQVPWHGIGKAVPQDVKSEEAIRLAGLDWEVEVAPLVSNDVKRTSVNDWRITRRVTDNVILGVVPKKFKPIQNRDAFKMFDIVQGKDGGNEAVYHTAGSLKGGSRIFILAKLPELIEIGKDEIERYILLSNAHDGSRQLQMLFTPVRVVCSNTLSIALHGKNDDALTKFSPRVSVAHTKNSDKMMKEASRTMGKALEYYKKFGEFGNFLHDKQVDVRQVRGILEEVFPPNKKKIVTPAVFGHRAAVEQLFTEGKGHDKIAGSAWALLNAFAEYADHSYAVAKSKEPQDRSYSILMGGSKGMKQRAEKTIVQAVS